MFERTISQPKAEVKRSTSCSLHSDLNFVLKCPIKKQGTCQTLIFSWNFNARTLLAAFEFKLNHKAMKGSSIYDARLSRYPFITLEKFFDYF